MSGVFVYHGYGKRAALQAAFYNCLLPENHFLFKKDLHLFIFLYSRNIISFAAGGNAAVAACRVFGALQIGRKTWKNMKIRIEVVPNLGETEVTIRCGCLDDRVVELQQYIDGQGEHGSCLALYRGDTVFYVPMEEIYFFETEGREIHAHTADRIFSAPYKLYELEELLPAGFMRAAKSTIVNLDHIYSITRNLTASSVVEFTGSCKKALVSRSYYRALVERLNIRRLGRSARKLEGK